MRRVSLLLIFALLLSYMPLHTESYASTSLFESEEYSPLEVERYVADVLNNSVPIVRNVKGFDLYFNVKLHKEKGVLVYGNYEDVLKIEQKNDFKILEGGYYRSGTYTGEYRCHGYTIDGNLYHSNDFPRDSDSGRSVSEKEWIYHYWDELYGQDASLTTIDATSLRHKKDYPLEHKMLRMQIDDMVNDVLKNSTGYGERDYNQQGYAVADHLNVNSLNSTLFNGEGKMMQRNAGRLWYQMFSTEKANSKESKDQDITVEILDKGNYKFDGLGQSTIKVKVVGSYLDASIDTDAEKIIYYHQNEMKGINLRLQIGNKIETHLAKPNTLVNGNSSLEYVFELCVDEGDIKNGVITAKGSSWTTFYTPSGEAVNTTVSAFDIDNIGGGIKSIFDVKDVQLLPDPSDPSKTLPFTVDMLDYQDFSIGIIDIYELKVTTCDGSRTETFTYIGQPTSFVIDLYDFITVDNQYSHYTVTQVVKNSTSVSSYVDTFAFKKEIKKAIELDIEIPHHVIDIDPIEAKDKSNYDGQTVKSKSIKIDGQSVEWDDFFGGKYKFGETHNNFIAMVEFKVINDQDVESIYTETFNVHSSLPRTKLVAEGSLKENRKVTLYNKSADVEDAFVTAKYPTTYSISYSAVDGSMSDWKMKTVTENEIDMLFKKSGFYKATISASNAARSKPTSTDYHIGIVPDFEPNVYFNIWNNVLSRNEELNITYSADSLDGDVISSNNFKVYFDENEDGVAEKLIYESEDQLNFFAPTMLGIYKIVNTIEESYGEPTIAEFITGADKKNKLIERVFYVDNLRPLVEIDLDIPENFQKVDMYIMSDENLEDINITELRESRIDYNNSLRLYGLDGSVVYRDLKTYIQTQQIDTSKYYGETSPPSSLSYSSSGFSGTLSKYNVTNNSYEDYYTTEKKYKSCKTKNVFNGYVNCDAICYRDCRGCGCSDCDSACCDKDYTQKEVCTTKTTTKRHYYTVNRYTGYYKGTAYKSVKQPFTNPFRETSDKYVIYIASDAFNLDDLNKLRFMADVNVILIGNAALRDALSDEMMFIKNDGSNMDILMGKAIDAIGAKHPFSSKYLVQVGDKFTLNQIMFDTEGDSITSYGYQYVQEEVYDNPTGLETFARTSYNQQQASFTNYVARSFNRVGLFDIYALLKDRTGQAFFDKESNVSNVSILVHRKPVANFRLDWTYDPVDSKYQTRFIDKSYDLDHQYSDIHKGIRDVKAMYRDTSSSTWIYAVPGRLSSGTYEFRYSVKDMEGVWSDPKISIFTLSETPPPQLLQASLKANEFTFSLESIPGTEYLRFYDIETRYPYDHELVYRWVRNKLPISPDIVYDEAYHVIDQERHYEDLVFQVPKAYVNGEYQIELIVRDKANHINCDSEFFDIAINTPINLVTCTPEVVFPGSNLFSCETSEYVDEVKLILYDGTSYAETYNMVKSANRWTYAYEASLVPDGFYDVTYKAIIHSTPYQDDSKTDVIEKISLKALSISVKGAWTYWDGGKNIFGETLTDEPHRFMSLESIDIEAETIGEPDEIEIMMSPELMAMTYVDDNNNTYCYEDIVGEEIAFPIYMSSNDDKHWYSNYVLPLADSTRDLDNKYLRTPYWIKIVLKKGVARVEYLIDDIDITGNTMDHLYLQPKID